MLPTRSKGCVVRILLSRHGETDLNAEKVLQGSGVDPPLNSKGREQAERLSARLENHEIKLVYSSHLQRARETAECVAKRHGLQVTENRDLAEISWGEYEGQKAPDLTELHQKWDQGDFDFAAKNGESPNQVKERAERAIRQIINEAIEKEAETVILVAHGRFLRILISWIVHRSLQYMGTVAHYNCNINVIDVCKRQQNFESLRNLSKQSLSKLSQTLVQQERYNGVQAKRLDEVELESSNAVSYDDLIGSKWDELWYVCVLINDTKHLQ